MESMLERRSDDAMREVITQALEFKNTLGQSSAVAFLVEHHVPPPVLQRVLMANPTPNAPFPQGSHHDLDRKDAARQ